MRGKQILKGKSKTVLKGKSKTVITIKKTNEKENNKLVRIHLSTYFYQAVEMSNI